MLMARNLCMVILLLTLLASPFMQSEADATVYGGIDFANGSLSFAGSVVSYIPGPGVTPKYNDPTKALGTPNNTVVELGLGGTLVVKFLDSWLTASGDDTKDLWIFEYAGHVEPTDVFISIDQQDWVSVGRAAGGSYGIDIDSFAGVVSGQTYSYVKMIDSNVRITPDGADIDAVGAFRSAASLNKSTPVAPEPVSTILFIVGGATLGLRRFFK